MQGILEWLKGLGLEEYAGAFERQRVTVALLGELSDQDLREIGVEALGDRRLMLKAIAQLRDGAPTLSTSTPSAPTPPATPSEAAERRQITVLFCDLVGFTALASRVDPEVLRQVVRTYEDTCAAAITRYEGYVYQRLGDGIVAYFGYPLAHEGEAERAIHAAEAIIEALAQQHTAPEALQVRIGIATGLVVVARGRDQGAVGETMNLAARLQGIAPVGAILVSERTRQLAAGSFEYEDLGPQVLKGLSEPVRAWRVRGRSIHASRFEAATHQGITPLVGREQELGLLCERWQRAREGEGQVVLLSGEPGIGKSRLLNALRERLVPPASTLLTYQCSPFFASSALHPFLEALTRHLRFGRDEPPASRLDKLEAWVTKTHARPVGLVSEKWTP